MELRKGMYVMTNDRMKIGKIKGFCTCEMCEKRGFYEPIIDGDIIITDYDKSRGFHGYKFYDNPIDLIEVGDYVNGKEVTEIMKDEKGNVTDVLFTEEVESQSYSLLPIKDIVTKEQFNSVKYEVE